MYTLDLGHLEVILSHRSVGEIISLYRAISPPNCVKHNGKCHPHNRNNKGLSTDPWGTPGSTGSQSEKGFCLDFFAWAYHYTTVSTHLRAFGLFLTSLLTP